MDHFLLGKNFSFSPFAKSTAISEGVFKCLLQVPFVRRGEHEHTACTTHGIHLMAMKNCFHKLCSIQKLNDTVCVFQTTCNYNCIFRDIDKWGSATMHCLILFLFIVLDGIRVFAVIKRISSEKRPLPIFFVIIFKAYRYRG